MPAPTERRRDWGVLGRVRHLERELVLPVRGQVHERAAQIEAVGAPLLAPVRGRLDERVERLAAREAAQHELARLERDDRARPVVGEERRGELGEDAHLGEDGRLDAEAAARHR